MKRYRNPVEQVNEILDQNARILAMNEKLLQAIVKNHDVNRVTVTMDPINVDELLRNKP